MSRSSPKDVSGIKAAGPLAVLKSLPGQILTVEFVGSFAGGIWSARGRRCVVYTYTGVWKIDGLRVSCDGMQYARHASKICRVLYGNKVIFSR